MVIKYFVLDDYKDLLEGIEWESDEPDNTNKIQDYCKQKYFKNYRRYFCLKK